MRQSGQNASEVCAAEETGVIDIKDAESGFIKKEGVESFSVSSSAMIGFGLSMPVIYNEEP
jgi:hypothetical protein